MYADGYVMDVGRECRPLVVKQVRDRSDIVNRGKRFSRG